VGHLLVLKEVLSNSIRIRCFTIFDDTFLEFVNFLIKFSSVSEEDDETCIV
ncbi:hypothetical protein A2U01_0068709, partial [Trifolium medium]|nr:hypothetical protein [Trifolium medium]